jgi:hypothetical protein
MVYDRKWFTAGQQNFENVGPIVAFPYFMMCSEAAGVDEAELKSRLQAGYCC